MATKFPPLPYNDAAKGVVAEVRAWRGKLNKHNMNQCKVGATFCQIDDVERALKAMGEASQNAARVAAAAQALLDAFGGDVPDWLQSEATELHNALQHL